MVAGLATARCANKAVSSAMMPWRRRAGRDAAIIAFSRLEQIWSDTSHRTARASRPPDGRTFSRRALGSTADLDSSRVAR